MCFGRFWWNIFHTDKVLTLFRLIGQFTAVLALHDPFGVDVPLNFDIIIIHTDKFPSRNVLTNCAASTEVSWLRSVIFAPLSYKHSYYSHRKPGSEVAVLAVAAKVVLSNWSRPIENSPGQLSGTNHITV